MTDFQHGMRVNEIKTKSKSVTLLTNGVVVAVGKAPIHLAQEEPTLKPVLVKNIDDFKRKFGYSEDFQKYSLCEVADVFFNLYLASPVIFINVVDPAEHFTDVPNTTVNITNGVAVVDDAVILSSLEVKLTAEGQPLEKGTDYLVTPLESGKVQISVLTGGAIAPNATQLTVTYKKLDVDKVTEADIIGAYDANTGVRTGIEAIQDVFSSTGKVPGSILTPGYSSTNVVAALKGKVDQINGIFKSCYLIDLDQSKANVYTKAATEKTNIGINDPNSIPLYASVSYAGKQYHLSTHVAALKATVDVKNGNLPYEGPSNKRLIADSILINGKEASLDMQQANTLNAEGIGTVIRFGQEFLFWGNRTGAYPISSDTKDVFIPVRSMFNYISNTFILRFWSKVDNPTNLRLIDDFVNNFNITLNSWASTGAIIGGRIEFRKEDNPVENIRDGKLKFYIASASPIPAESIEAELEYDISYLYQLVA